MALFLQYLESEVAEMKAAGVRLRVIGDRSAFAPMLQSRIDQAEQDTAHNTGLHLTIAANYSGSGMCCAQFALGRRHTRIVHCKNSMPKGWLRI